MKKILYISTSDPEDKSSGGAQRSRFLYQALRAQGEVYTIIPVSMPSLERVDEDRKIEWICLDRRYTFRWALQRLFNRCFPLLVCPFYARNLPDRLRRDGDFDCVVVRYTQWASYFAAWRIAPLLIDIDDSPIEFYDTVMAPRCRSGLKRSLNRWLLQRWCRWIYRKATGGWIANADQVGAIEGIKPKYLPNLAMPAPEGFTFDREKENFLLTVGYLGYAPNYEGVDQFIEESWPLLHAAKPELSYYVVGKDCPAELKEKWSSVAGVKVLGFVDDLEALYESCLMTVAPVYSGSGTCIKVIESLLRGRICVAAPFALRGIDRMHIQDANGLCEASSSEAFIAKIASYCEQPEQLKMHESNARVFATSYFAYQQFEDAVADVLIS